MVGVYFQGRMGNQLFQYAFAFSESKKLNTDFFMLEKIDNIIIDKYFELGHYRRFNSKFKRFFFTKDKFKLSVELNNAKSYLENKLLLNQNNCLYKGYFQSELYFKEIHAELLKEFKIKDKYQIDVRRHLKIVDKKPLLVLHVRRTDYLKHGDNSLGGEDLSLPIKYYIDCLASVKDKENYTIVFVTDDPAFVKSNFEHLSPIISFDKNLIVDFQILLAADIVVTANSSFSWWAAYLNTNCKRVLAPKYWLGFRIKNEYPCNIIPEAWEQIEIN